MDDHKVTQYLGVVSGEAIPGANAVVGVDSDCETITFSDSGSVLMVTADGTAVVVAG